MGSIYEFKQRGAPHEFNEAIAFNIIYKTIKLPANFNLTKCSDAFTRRRHVCVRPETVIRRKTVIRRPPDLESVRINQILP
jgi:hypothetical protein